MAKEPKQQYTPSQQAKHAIQEMTEGIKEAIVAKSMACVDLTSYLDPVEVDKRLASAIEHLTTARKLNSAPAGKAMAAESHKDV